MKSQRFKYHGNGDQKAQVYNLTTEDGKIIKTIRLTPNRATALLRLELATSNFKRTYLEQLEQEALTYHEYLMDTLCKITEVSPDMAESLAKDMGFDLDQ